jgi:transposase
VHNRIEKLLQQANVKLSSVATDILGVTGRNILAALLGGNEDAKSLADCAKGTLRRKKDQLAQALQAKLTIHQRFMLREFLDDLKFVEGKIARLEETIQERISPHEEVLNRLNTIPGVNRPDRLYLDRRTRRRDAAVPRRHALGQLGWAVSGRL